MEIPRKQLKSQEIVHGSVPAAMKIPRKRLKSQGIVGEGEDDRISALPDGLLLDVLSRLPSTGDAIRTGILSKRWEQLWTLVPTLVFEQDDVKHSRSDFLSLVDKTLTQCRQQKLKKFQVRFTGYRSGDELQVNNWIRYAMGCNVEEVMLTLGDGEAAHFRVDQSLFIGSSITDLRLSGCILNPTGAIAWQSLKNLHLHIADLNEALIGNILCGSPALETLVLDDCYGFRLLNIASTSVKKLVYSARKNPHRAEYKKLVDYLIDVYAPFISSLTIQGDLHLWRLLMVNVSSLVEANLDYKNDETLPEAVEEGRFKILMGRLLHVKEIKIGPSCSKVVSCLEAKGFLFPSGVKFVKSLEDL